jgi:DNA-binding GntR family transcriptional regulator
MLGVSRTSVREALGQLVAEGLVQIIPHKGPIVAVITRDEAKGLYEVRAELEALAGRSFTERASSDQRTQLVTALEKLAAILEMQNDESILLFLREKANFYRVLLAGAGNPVLTEMLGLMHTRVMMLRATTLSQKGRLQESYREVAAIVDAVLRNDADEAAAACARHVKQAEGLAIQALGDIK